MADSRPEITDSRKITGHPAIQGVSYCQNVAGLWLKYGVVPRKAATYPRLTIVLGDVTIS
jgi:hypothetical protein